MLNGKTEDIGLTYPTAITELASLSGHQWIKLVLPGRYYSTGNPDYLPQCIWTKSMEPSGELSIPLRRWSSMYTHSVTEGIVIILNIFVHYGNPVGYPEISTQFNALQFWSHLGARKDMPVWFQITQMVKIPKHIKYSPPPQCWKYHASVNGIV